MAERFTQYQIDVTAHDMESVFKIGAILEGFENGRMELCKTAYANGKPLVFKDCFNLYDKDQDGKVEKGELTKIMRALGHCVTHIEIQEMMKEHGKPTVTFPECLKMLAGQKAKVVNIEKEILDAFILSDKSKKGYISRGDLEHLLMKGGEGMDKAEVQQLLAQCGIDRMITQINYKDLSKRISASAPVPQ